MTDRDVSTIRDLIYCQYAKTIAKSPFAASDGREAKGRHYGFIKQSFRELRPDALARSDCRWGDDGN